MEARSRAKMWMLRRGVEGMDAVGWEEASSRAVVRPRTVGEEEWERVRQALRDGWQTLRLTSPAQDGDVAFS